MEKMLVSWSLWLKEMELAAFRTAEDWRKHMFIYKMPTVAQHPARKCNP